MYRLRERGSKRALPDPGSTLSEFSLIPRRPEKGDGQMDNPDFGSRDTTQKRKAHRSFDGKIQYLLSAEEQLLRSISIRAPLPEVLNAICCALDCQIGNVVSLICLPGGDASEVAAIAMNAARFGLHTFCSERVVADNAEPLGSLKIYGTVQRSPSAEEFQFIERAKCLAAIAIKRQMRRILWGIVARLAIGQCEAVCSNG